MLRKCLGRTHLGAFQGCPLSLSPPQYLGPVQIKALPSLCWKCVLEKPKQEWIISHSIWLLSGRLYNILVNSFRRHDLHSWKSNKIFQWFPPTCLLYKILKYVYNLSRTQFSSYATFFFRNLFSFYGWLAYPASLKNKLTKEGQLAGHLSIIWGGSESDSATN